MLISIIVPIYKVEPYLRQCVDSLVNQTYTDLEIILVDDGSPDTCPEICDYYAAQDSRIKVIHKKNGGLSSARQAGVNAANGDYVMIVDGDDWLSVEALATCKEVLDRKGDVDCLIFSYVREYPQRKLIAHVMNESCVLYGAEVEDKVYRRLFGLIGDELTYPERLENMGSCCMKLYKREHVKKGRFFDTAEVGSSEDVLFNMYALYGCRSIVYLDEPFYHYRKNENSISNSYRSHLIEQWGRLFDYMEAVIEEKELDRTFRQAMDSRVALSVFGIGMNELSATDSFHAKMKRIKQYISNDRYKGAVKEINIVKMPLPWKAMLFFARNGFSFLLCMELSLIQLIRSRF